MINQVLLNDKEQTLKNKNLLKDNEWNKKRVEVPIVSRGSDVT